MGGQRGEGDEVGEMPATEAGAPGPPIPSRAPSTLGDLVLGEEARDERLAGFVRGGEWDGCLPGPELAAVLAGVGGGEWRCPGAEPDELIGVLRRATALESWASAAKLAVIRELIRQDDLPVLGRPRHGDLPDQWSDSLNHELALALASSVGSVEHIALTAWELGARLPGIAALLADGTLTYAKARLIAETFRLLGDADAERAEALIIPQLTGATGKTYGQIINLAGRIATEVDPGLAERRRKAAVKHTSRVQMFREQSGAAALCGRDLPPDETLAAYANVTARAEVYKGSGVFPSAPMDQFRAAAYIDLIRGMTADARIALGYLSTDPQESDTTPVHLSTAPNGRMDEGEPDGGDPGGMAPPGGDRPSQGGPGNGCRGDSDGGGVGRPGGSDSGDDDAPASYGPGGSGPTAFQLPSGGRPVLADLVLPLATLLGLAERPGEAHGLGVLDPDLCRDLAALAGNSQHSRLCITVTDADGVAIGHACGRARESVGADPGHLPAGATPPEAPPPGGALPARANLTITADRLFAMLSGVPGSPEDAGQPQPTDWTLTWIGRTGQRNSRGSPDDPEWCGTWVLTLPGGRQIALRIEPVPTYGCDHRYESHGYQPNDTLRHLIQVRDYTCTFPSCSRHARDSDFEHAQPYDKGGRTCSCNAGARSRKCHRVKQSPGWTVTQPQPGWHAWTTPSGRTYIQAPYRYPV